MPFQTNVRSVPIAPGVVRARVAHAEEKSTKKGAPMVEVTWELLEGRDQGRTLRDWIAFVPGMEGRNNHLLELLGQPHYQEGVEEEGLVWVNAEEWIGKELVLKIVNEVGDSGQKRATIVEYQRASTETGAAAPSTSKGGDVWEGDLPPF